MSSDIQQAITKFFTCVKKKAVYEQLLAHLQTFIPTDTKKQPLQISAKHGDYTVVVDVATLERIKCDLEDRIAELVEIMQEAQ